MSGILLHSPAHIVSRILIAEGLASDPTPSLGVWPVIVGRVIDKPDNLITIRNTTGRDSGFLQVSGRLTEMPGIQIRVRGIDENIAHAKARAIAVALDESIEGALVALSGTSYYVHSIDRVGGVIDLGKEGVSVRHIYTINAIVTLNIDEVIQASQTLSPISASADGAWQNTGNILTSDDQYSFAQINGGDISGTLTPLYAFSVPPTATILGIEAKIERAFPNAGGGGIATDHTVRLKKSSGLVGSNKADIVTPWIAPDTVITYGGSTDLWGTSWTPAEINDPLFGLAFRAQMAGLVSGTTVRVDHIPITVYYEY